MLFNSLSFLLFFPIVSILYWVLPHKFRNSMLLIASYYFYMNWEPIYAILIAITTITTWFCGNMLEKSSEHKKIYLSTVLILNLLILFIYKYLNFVTESVFGGLEYLGIRMDVPHFDLLLPVGISFYTFQAIGYIIDVYRGTINAEKNLATYALFVSFFPQLVAGPIERAKNLLPQFHTKHTFNGDIFIEGIKLMVWGYFMKLGIAENVAPYVDAVYNNMVQHNGTSILFATFLFTFQIFCDFGGYSLIAIGTAKCMGFDLMQNFNRPYLARSMRDFWRRWHISLSSWFADYVYIPMGGSRCSAIKHQRNLFLTMFISGIWHGANWTFILWGVYHGILQVLNAIKRKISWLDYGEGNIFVKIGEVIFTFLLAMFGWIFFRANNVNDAFMAFEKIFTQPGLLYNGDGKPTTIMFLGLIALLMFKELKDELKLNIHLLHNKNYIISSVVTALMIILLLMCAKFEGGQFIYFQF